MLKLKSKSTRKLYVLDPHPTCSVPGQWPEDIGDRREHKTPNLKPGGLGLDQQI